MAGNENPVKKLIQLKIIKYNILKTRKQARYGRPDPRRDSCMNVVTDTSGSSEMYAEQQYMRSG